VNRVFQSLDLNPLLIDTLNNVTSLVDDVVGEVDGLLGSITQGGTTVKFIVDNLGNIVQQVGDVSSIVGNYVQNMTYTGTSKSLGSGLTEKVYSYSPLNALVDIVRFSTHIAVGETHANPLPSRYLTQPAKLCKPLFRNQVGVAAAQVAVQSPPRPQARQPSAVLVHRVLMEKQMIKTGTGSPSQMSISSQTHPFHFWILQFKPNEPQNSNYGLRRTTNLWALSWKCVYSSRSDPLLEGRTNDLHIESRLNGQLEPLFVYPSSTLLLFLHLNLPCMLLNSLYLASVDRFHILKMIRASPSLIEAARQIEDLHFPL